MPVASSATGCLRAPSYCKVVRSRLSLSRSLTSMKLADRQRVAILGSGWAGYNIAQRLDPSRFEPIIISPRSYFAFTPLLASTAVGTLEFRNALEPVRRKGGHTTFIQGWGDQIDFARKIISVEESVADPLQDRALTSSCAGRNEGAIETEIHAKRQKGRLFNVHYDKLVIAVGCYAQTFGIVGVREHAFFLKDVGDARQIRNRLLSCFEAAALPTTSEEMKQNLLNFVIVGGGATGIEFSAELHDIITEDLVKLYPQLTNRWKISVYDVASTVLPMFDKKLSEYAMNLFRREGIQIKTSRHVEGLRLGSPNANETPASPTTDLTCFTLKVKEEGNIGAGMVVWSTGLMMNPLVSQNMDQAILIPNVAIQHEGSEVEEPQIWKIRKNIKTGALLVDKRLRVVAENNQRIAVMEDVFAIGDCASVEGAAYPATAQVASQQAGWLAKRLNKGDIEKQSFSWRNLGTMAYLGNWNAIVQSSGADVSGRAAWLIWRGAYLTKSVSWRNKLLIPIYWSEK